MSKEKRQASGSSPSKFFDEMHEKIEATTIKRRKLYHKSAQSQPESLFLQFKPEITNVKDKDEVCYFSSKSLSQSNTSNNLLKSACWKPPLKLNENCLEQNIPTQKQQEKTIEAKPHYFHHSGLKDDNLHLGDKITNTSINESKHLDALKPVLESQINFSPNEFEEKLNLNKNKDDNNSLLNNKTNENVCNEPSIQSNLFMEPDNKESTVEATISSPNQHLDDSNCNDSTTSLRKDISKYDNYDNDEEESFLQNYTVNNNIEVKISTHGNQNLSSKSDLKADGCEENENCVDNEHDDIINSIDIMLSEGKNSQESQDDQMLVDSIFKTDSPSPETTKSFENESNENIIDCQHKEIKDNYDKNNSNKVSDCLQKHITTSLSEKEVVGESTAKPNVLSQNENNDENKSVLRGEIDTLDDEYSCLMISNSQLLEIEKKYYETPQSNMLSVQVPSSKFVSVGTQTEPQECVALSLQWPKNVEDLRKKLREAIQEINSLNTILLKVRQEIWPQHHLAEPASVGFSNDSTFNNCPCTDTFTHLDCINFGNN